VTNHLSVSAELIELILGLVAVAAVLVRIGGARREIAVLSSNEPAPAQNVSPRSGSGRAVAGVLVALGSLLGSLYILTQTRSHDGIRFYPGQYRRVPFSSGEAVSTAMRAVNTAPNDEALDVALAAVQRMADGGDAEAAFRLGRYYQMERAEPDYALALKFYESALEKNHPWAINNLGLMYRDGLGVAQNEKTAYGFFQEAARLNNPWAYVNLADMTFEGRSVKADPRAAIGWLEQGGHNNCTLCLIEEAAIYHVGEYGIHADRSKTVALLEKAAAVGEDQPKLLLAEMYVVGDGVRQSSRSAFDILKALSDNGYADASVLLGELSSDDKIRNYLFDSALGGVGNMPADLTGAFPRDIALSIHYWERANEQGSCQSWIDLSSLYDRGVGVGMDTRRAADYVERAVKCDPTNSFYVWKLGMRFYDAKGVDRDCEAAKRLFERSLGYGYPDAAINLGYIYDKGCAPIAQNDQLAFQIYLLGAKLGVPLCQNNVGAMIKHGRGVPAADLARGYGWIKLAALHGDPLAKSNLGDPLYTPCVRVAGLANLADIQSRLLLVPASSQAILRDPWY
jgi:TPR repeat protein